MQKNHLINPKMGNGLPLLKMTPVDFQRAAICLPTSKKIKRKTTVKYFRTNLLMSLWLILPVSEMKKPVRKNKK